MAWTATDFAGRGCGRRYEKELETHFRDCMLFYLDGRIRFERYCYGEAACLVFSVWGHGICVAKMLDNTQSIICAFGLAAATPRSPYRNLELCGIVLSFHVTFF